MASNSETSHAINVANLNKLNEVCTGFGPNYNPQRDELKVVNLGTLHTSGVLALKAVNDAFGPWKNAVANREILFSPINELATRIIGALNASNVPAEQIANVLTIIRKIQGRRATPRKPDVPDNPATPEDESFKSISASQMSFDNRIEHMDALISLLQTLPDYAPNENDLTTVSLTNYYTNMVDKNNSVITNRVPLDNARLARNAMFYTPETGLVDTAIAVKDYVKSLFTATSPQYKLVKVIPFKNIIKL